MLVPRQHPIQTVGDAAGDQHPVGRRRRIHRLSIRAGVPAHFGFDGLTEIRQSQTRQLAGADLRTLKNSLVIYSRGSTATEALQAFTAGSTNSPQPPIDPQQQQAIADYYNNQFAKAEDNQTGNEVDVTALLPTSNATEVSAGQLHHAVHRLGPSRIRFDDARDGSAWSAANARYNEFFREIVTRFEFEDALLLDTARQHRLQRLQGRRPRHATSSPAPTTSGELTEAYNKAMASNAVDYVAITDFGDYQPRRRADGVDGVAGRPRRASVEGVLALQFPISKINRLMTMDKRWEESGMGKTGETFIVGPDDLMRSDSRLFLEDPGGVQTRRDRRRAPRPMWPRTRSASTAPPWCSPSATEATQQAQRGHRGTLIAGDYLGPRDAAGLRARSTCRVCTGRVIAKIDTSEAFAPVSAFTRTLVLSTAVIIFVVCIAAMLLARLFVAADPAAGGRCPADQRRRLRRDRPRAVARRIRRSRQWLSTR